MLTKTKEQSILATLCFFSLFRHPITRKELEDYLLGQHVQREELEKLIRSIPAIRQEKNILFLRGENFNIDAYEDEKDTLRKRMKKAYRFAPWLQMIPFIRGVYVCNNLSFGIATSKGDIDLFIITHPRHLFLCRFFTTLFFHILGIRRHGKKIKDRFCLSFYTTEDNLDIASLALKPYDIYLAYWLTSLVPIIDKDIYKKLLIQNKNWLADYFDANTLERFSKKHNTPQKQPILEILQKIQEQIWETSWGRWCEKKMADYQKGRIKKHYTQLKNTSGIIIAEKMLKFHNEDRREAYYKAWLHKIEAMDSDRIK